LITGGGGDRRIGRAAGGACAEMRTGLIPLDRDEDSFRSVKDDYGLT
jgi:hypothetical protein